MIRINCVEHSHWLSMDSGTNARALENSDELEASHFLVKHKALPAELYNEIIGYLWNDSHALKSCALASWDMTRPSQKRLFHSVAICPQPEPLPESIPTKYKDDPRNATIGTFSKFQQLLDGSPHIAQYIISLHLSDLSWSYRLQVHEFEYPGIGFRTHGGRRWLLTDASLQPYLGLLRNLKALTIECEGNPLEGSCSTFRAILQQPSLLYIRILRSSCPIQALNRTIGPNIEHLSLIDWCPEDETSPLSFEPPSSQVYLKTLTIRSPTAFVSLMTSPTFRLQTSRLRRLVIHSQSYSEKHLATWTILETCSSTLEEFEFRPTHREWCFCE